MEKFRWLAGVIAAHKDGNVIGRTRLQKTMLLLQQKGLPTDYEYSIYFYGPYSEGLASDVGLLGEFGFIEEEMRENTRGTPYYIIKAKWGAQPDDVGSFRNAIARIEQTDDVPLELAATYSAYYEMFLDKDEALARLRMKKGRKCSPENIKAAMALLQDLELPAA